MYFVIGAGLSVVPNLLANTVTITAPASGDQYATESFKVASPGAPVTTLALQNVPKFLYTVSRNGLNVSPTSSAILEGYSVAGKTITLTGAACIGVDGDEFLVRYAW